MNSEIKPITPEDRPLFEQYMRQNPEPTVEYSFPWLYIWSERWWQGYTIWRDWLLLNAHGQDGEEYWAMPYGPLDCREAVLACKEMHARRYPEQPFAMVYITERSKALLQAWFSNAMSFEIEDGLSDYLYNVEDLAHLRGKKYHSKRNHVNRFMAAYDRRYSHEPITVENLDEIYQFEKCWVRRNKTSETEDSLRAESAATRALLANLDTLDAKSRLLRVDGKVIAFTIGAPCGDNAMDIMCEKADYDYAGAYQTINKLFALHDCVGKQYINREEDLGIEGLRKAKLSYNPVRLIDKYEAIWHD
ncbi:MAG: phosphatidylglycerol lysyltransferase domain-containing protein [Oscillospiraceae bacterium]|nr:phosphatidylglycerol lysyltransferase domain-containing protein [Oscillospiraceae bacterium]